MNYTFKPTPELWWAVVTVVVTTIAASFAVGSAPPSDWRTFLIGVAAAATRAGLGALLSAWRG